MEELQAIWKEQCGAADGSQPAAQPAAKFCGAPGPHVMTGPVAVTGAQPGDVLKVEVLSAEPWARGRSSPLSSPRAFTATHNTFWAILPFVHAQHSVTRPITHTAQSITGRRPL